MESFNVLRGKEPVTAITEIRNQGEENEETVTVGGYCAGYIKFLPDRAKIFGIEFSGYDKTSNTYKNPDSGFDYYIFCSETAWRDYAKSESVTLEPKIIKEPQNVGNPALYIVSSGTYDTSSETPSQEGEGEEVVSGTIKYPHLIGFQGVRYSHEPRPYSNVDAFVNSNDVQYPLYIFVKFHGDPGITELDYQLIYGK